jgi:Tat protein secretion system quality control protein TatD with DNase activity
MWITHQYSNATMFGSLTSIAMPKYMTTYQCSNAEWSYMMVLPHWWVVIYVGITILVSGPICWHCFTGEWSYMLALLYWWVVLYVGIASLVNGPICWHCNTGEWSLFVGIASLVSGPICWHCYTDEWSYMCLQKGTTHQCSNSNKCGSLTSIAMPKCLDHSPV